MQLSIDLLMKFAQASDALDSLAKKAEGAFSKINSGASALKGTFASLGATLTVGAFVAFIKGSIDAADRLHDLSQKTGIAAETLGGLGFAAKQSGGNLEDFSAAAGKLNRSIAEAGAGNEKKLDVFNKLGINVHAATGELKTADQIMIELADKFQSYADGPNKVAIAIALMSRAGADQIPVLNEGGKKLKENIEYFKRYSGVTEDVVKRADEFNDTLAKLHLLSGALGTKIASELLGPLQALANYLLNVKENSTAFEKVAAKLKGTVELLAIAVYDLATAYVQTGEAAFTMLDVSQKLLKFDLSGATLSLAKFGLGFRQASRDMEDFENRVLRRGKYTRSAITDAEGQEGGFYGPTDKTNRFGKKPQAPGLNDQESINKANALAKAIADYKVAQDKVILESAKQVATDLSQILDSYYKAGLVSEESYWTERARIQSNAYNVEKSAIESEIATREQAAEVIKAKSGKTKEYYEALVKTVEAKGKLTQLEEARSTRVTEDTLAKTQATKAYGEAVRAVSAQILELTGHTEAAARIRIEDQLAKGRKDAENRGDAAAVAQYDLLARTLQLQTRYNALRTQGSDLELDHQLELQRIQNDRGLNEIERLSYTDAANARYSVSLAKLKTTLENLATESGLPEVTRHAKELGGALDDLKAHADTLGDRFKTIFEDTFTDEFAKVIDGTQKIGAAFRNMARSIISEIAKIQARNLAKAITGNFSLGGSSSSSGATSYDEAEFQRVVFGSYASGTDYVPRTGPYLLHQGEQVLSAGQGRNVVLNIDNRGAYPESYEDLRRLVLEVSNSVEARSVKAVLKARLQGIRA